MEGKENFSIFQSESTDFGKTWSKPHQLLPQKGGAPSHIIEKDGVLISVYGYRQSPYGIRAMFSYDGGETWETDCVLVDNEVSGDLGYPATVELKDGSLLTVYYQKPAGLDNTVIMQSIWRLPERK